MSTPSTKNLRSTPYYVLSVVKEGGDANYLCKGEYSYFEIRGGFNDAVKFESAEEIQELINTHPEFTKRNDYSDGTSMPPSIIWSGLGICNASPIGSGHFVIQQVNTCVVYSQRITDSLQYK